MTLASLYAAQGPSLPGGFQAALSGSGWRRGLPGEACSTPGCTRQGFWSSKDSADWNGHKARRAPSSGKSVRSPPRGETGPPRALSHGLSPTARPALDGP